MVDTNFGNRNAHPEEEISLSGVHSVYTYDINGTDTDYKDQIHMHAILSMMQEAASRNASVYGWGAEVLDGLNICWLLLRVSVRMEKRPSWLQKIRIETWSRGAERLYFNRDFNIYDESGLKIGGASSVWILADKTTHRPVRPDAILQYAQKASDPIRALDFDTPKLKALFEADYMSENTTGGNTIVKYADFSEIDRNHHVNNTRYAAWCLDAAHNKSLDQGDIIGIDINYNAEIHFGEKVILFFEKEEGKGLHVDGFVTDRKSVAFSAVLYERETI